MIFQSYLTVKQLALQFGYSPGTLYNWISSGKAKEKLPPYVQFDKGGKILFKKNDVEDFINKKSSA